MYATLKLPLLFEYPTRSWKKPKTPERNDKSSIFSGKTEETTIVVKDATSRYPLCCLPTKASTVDLDDPWLCSIMTGILILSSHHIIIYSTGYFTRIQLV